MARILKQDAERMLGTVPQEQAFWCCDGRMLTNMRELEEALASMPDEAFAYHSNSEKSDFGNWVSAIIGDEKLARDLWKSQNRMQAAKCVSTRVSFLDAKIC